MLNIGSRIYLRRLEQGLTQAQLAEKAGLPQPNLSNIEKGKQDLTVTTLRKIAWALELPAAEFLKEDEEKGKRLVLSRPVIERLAKALAAENPKAISALNPAEKEIAELVLPLLPSRQVQVRQMHLNWIKLKTRLDSAALHTLYERIRELKPGKV